VYLCVGGTIAELVDGSEYFQQADKSKTLVMHALIAVGPGRSTQEVYVENKR
jgi:hypothetical protein